MTGSTRELEFKLRGSAALAPDCCEQALVAATAGLCRDPAASGRHTDIYLDDPEQSLGRRGIGLRIRRGPDGAVACVKQRGTVVDGLHDRREWEQPWPGREPPTRADQLPPALRDLVEPFTRSRPLQPLLQLEVQREARRVLAAGRPIAELAFDRVIARHRGREVSFCEFELEVLAAPDECAQIAAALRKGLPVVPADDDKLTHSLLLLGSGEAPPAATDRLGGDMAVTLPFGSLLAWRLRVQMDRIAAAECAVRGEGTPLDVHELRVGLRRARTLVRAFRSAWQAGLAARAEATLAAASHRCAELRGHDAQVARLIDIAAALDLPFAAPIAEHPPFAADRAALLDRAHAHLRSSAHGQAMAEVESLADPVTMVPEVATSSTDRWGRRLRKAIRAARRRIRSLPSAHAMPDLHSVRLSLKRLRILAEELACAGHRMRRRGHRQLLGVLAHLGVVCDQDGVLAMVPALVRNETNPQRAAWLGAVYAAERGASSPCRAAAIRAAGRLDRPKFWAAYRRLADHARRRARD